MQMITSNATPTPQRSLEGFPNRLQALLDSTSPRSAVREQGTSALFTFESPRRGLPPPPAEPRALPPPPAELDPAALARRVQELEAALAYPYFVWLLQQSRDLFGPSPTLLVSRWRR